MSTAIVQSRGQITLPSEVRKQAGIEPGTVLIVRAVGPGSIRLIALPRLSPDELRELYPIDEEIDWKRDREAAEEAEAARLQQRISENT
jgi:AbrB family looped-hinge helix DNA binding protein